MSDSPLSDSRATRLLRASCAAFAMLALSASGGYASGLSVFDGNVLVGTDTERGQLHMVGPTLESTSPEFVWYGSSAAIRAGRMVSPGLWDPGNIGLYSMAFGSNVFARGRGSFVAGVNGYAYADYGAVSGGIENEVDDIGTAVGGGDDNIASVMFSVIAGGDLNLATGNISTIGGGYANIVSSDEATVPGGLANTASGQRSFAAGRAAYAEAAGTFVWADDEGIPLHSTVDNEFKARAGGGFVLVGAPTSPTVLLSSGSLMISTSPAASIAAPNIFISSSNGNVGIGTSSPAQRLDVRGAIVGSSSITASAFFGDGSHLTGIQTVAVSSRSADLKGITFTRTTYAIGVDTLTITLSGTNPVMVCFSGAINCGATNGNFGWGFLYDGGYISPQSSTVGVTYGHGYAGTTFTNPAVNACHMVPASSISAGSHRFTMTAICSAGAVTFGVENTTTRSEDHFFVYELH